MKMVSVFNDKGDEIRITKDMAEFYSTIGWNEAVVKSKKKAPEVAPEVVSEESE